MEFLLKECLLNIKFLFLSSSMFVKNLLEPTDLSFFLLWMYHGMISDSFHFRPEKERDDIFPELIFLAIRLRLKKKTP